MALLCRARLLIAWTPLERWRSTLGETRGDSAPDAAKQLARQVDRGAGWLPFETKCLPRAIALSWMLRRERIRHGVVIAVRPPQARERGDALHAWVEVDGERVIGDLPGPWVETLRLGA